MDKGTPIEIAELKKRAGITEQGEMPSNEKLARGIESALQQLNAGRPDAAKYYLEEMLKKLRGNQAPKRTW